MKKTLKDCAVVAGALAYVAAFVTPLQTFLANGSIYPFSVARVLPELLIAALALFAAAWTLLILLDRLTRGLSAAFAAAALACVYAESCLLSFGLPEINGGHQAELFSTGRAVWDTCVWAGIVAAALAAGWKFRSAAKWTALALAVLSTASLFDVKKEQASSAAAPQTPSGARAAGAAITSGFEWQLDVISNFRFSRERNVLVFVLDSMPGDIAAETLLSTPALAAKFPGFTAFTNNVAMHDCTKRGLPGLMTGEYFDPETSSPAEYPISMYAEKSFLVPYVDAEWETSFAPDFLPYGFTTAQIRERAEVKGKQKHGWAALLRRSNEVPYLSLFDITVFRIAPYAAKAPFLYAKIRHDPMFGQDESNFWYEHVMYPKLAAAGFTDSPKVLGVFHSRGAHPPLAFDRDGRRLPELGWGRDSLGALVSNPLHNLAALMDALREKKIYDRSFIVVMADHGVGIAPHQPGHHPSESAILWIKPEDASGPVSMRPTPTGYSRIPSLMRPLAERKIGIAEAESILREENRLFRYQDADDRYHDIVVGPDWKVISRKDW